MIIVVLLIPRKYDKIRPATSVTRGTLTIFLQLVIAVASLYLLWTAATRATMSGTHVGMSVWYAQLVQMLLCMTSHEHTRKSCITHVLYYIMFDRGLAVHRMPGVLICRNVLPINARTANTLEPPKKSMLDCSTLSGSGLVGLLSALCDIADINLIYIYIYVYRCV